MSICRAYSVNLRSKWCKVEYRFARKSLPPLAGWGTGGIVPSPWRLRMKRLVIGPLLALFTIASAPAAAQEALGDTAESGRKMEDGREGKGPTGFIALGPGATPAYDGAKSYQQIGRAHV